MIRRCTRSATRKRARQRNTRTNLALYYRGAQEGHREHKDSPYVDMCGVELRLRGAMTFFERSTLLSDQNHNNPVLGSLNYDGTRIPVSSRDEFPAEGEFIVLSVGFLHLGGKSRPPSWPLGPGVKSKSCGIRSLGNLYV